MSSALKQDLSIGSNLKNLRKAAGLTQAPSSGPAGGAGPSHLHRDISQNGTGEIQHPHLCIKSSQGNLQARQLRHFFPGDLTMKCKQDLSIGPNLKRLRKAAGLTQAMAVAQLQLLGFDISREILSQMENGRYNVPVSLLKALKQIYKVPSYDDFFQGI